jgi:hypothetical protein
MADQLRDLVESLTSGLQQLNKHLHSNPTIEPGVLSEFRSAVDDIRTTAWKVHELAHARHAAEDPQAVIALVARERVKRFEQMASNICADLDSGVLTPDLTRQTLSNPITGLGKRLSV